MKTISSGSVRRTSTASTAGESATEVSQWQLPEGKMQEGRGELRRELPSSAENYPLTISMKHFEESYNGK